MCLDVVPALEPAAHAAVHLRVLHESFVHFFERLDVEALAKSKPPVIVVQPVLHGLSSPLLEGTFRCEIDLRNRGMLRLLRLMLMLKLLLQKYLLLLQKYLLLLRFHQDLGVLCDLWNNLLRGR